MAPIFDTRRGVTLKESLGGQLVSIVLNLVSISLLSAFLTKRIAAVRLWKKLPLTMWLVLGIYIDSYIFCLATALILFGFHIDYSHAVCEAGILLCLVCYVSTKAIYMFLVEKTHIVRGTRTPRLKSKLYIFNSFGMLCVYGVIVVLNFVFRIARMESGVCVIGMKRGAMIPLISFDILVNVYLTILFLIPLSEMYSFRKTELRPASARLRTVAFRTFIGCLCTLTSSIVNLSVLMVLNGEPGWICLMCCNSDILFSAIVLQWITSRDNAASSTPAPGPTADSHTQRTLDDASCGTSSSGRTSHILGLAPAPAQHPDYRGPTAPGPGRNNIGGLHPDTFGVLTAVSYAEDWKVDVTAAGDVGLAYGPGRFAGGADEEGVVVRVEAVGSGGSSGSESSGDGGGDGALEKDEEMGCGSAVSEEESEEESEDDDEEDDDELEAEVELPPTQLHAPPVHRWEG